MVILVELLRKIIGIVRYDSRRKGRNGLRNLLGEDSEQFYKPDLLR